MDVPGDLVRGELPHQRQRQLRQEFGDLRLSLTKPDAWPRPDALLLTVNGNFLTVWAARQLGVAQQGLGRNAPGAEDDDVVVPLMTWPGPPRSSR
jgi:hypothetical protein